MLNADDERVAAMAAHTGASVLTFGRRGDVRVSDLELDELARAAFHDRHAVGERAGARWR